MTSVSRKGGRTKARKLRAEHGIAPDVALPDVLELAQATGLQVLIFEHLGNDIAGAYVCRGEERLVLLNGSDHTVRMRFTLAHEIAHHCFHDNAKPDTFEGLLRPPPGHWIEVRANAFAGELLVPEAALERFIEKRDLCHEADLYDVVALALEFGVSTPMAFFRLQDTDVAMDRARVRRQIDAGEHLAIWEQGDPFEDSLHAAAQRLPCIPERFRTTVFFRVALGELTLEQGAALMRIGPDDLRAALAPLGLLPPA